MRESRWGRLGSSAKAGVLRNRKMLQFRAQPAALAIFKAVKNFFIPAFHQHSPLLEALL